jgi:5'-3' exonuclease, N-terminal resolvase-like domain/T4 RNase H, C terminal
LNQVLYAGLRQQSAIKKDAKIDTPLIRHVVLNILRSYNKQFSAKYGELVLCCDSKHYWRRDAFPFYKIMRRVDREASGINWEQIFEAMNTIREELKENFNHKVIDVHGAEADDIIAILAKHHSKEPTLVISQDKDFIQLQKYGHVTQYNPLTKTYVSSTEPDRFLIEHIYRGDRGDGIPNILSRDDCFVKKERQKRLTHQIFDKMTTTDMSEWSDEHRRNFSRNDLLINFDRIPENIETAVNEAFLNVTPAKYSKFFNYMVEKLTALLSDIEDFK